MYLENFLSTVGLHLVCVVCLYTPDGRSIYRVYTSDCHYVEFNGYDKLPSPVRDWMIEHNSSEFVLSPCMVISGVVA